MSERRARRTNLRKAAASYRENTREGRKSVRASGACVAAGVWCSSGVCVVSGRVLAASLEVAARMLSRLFAVDELAVH